MRNETRERIPGTVNGILTTSFRKKAIVKFEVGGNELGTMVSYKKVARAVGFDNIREGDKFSAVVNVNAVAGKELRVKEIQSLVPNS